MKHDPLLDKRVIELQRIVADLEARGMWYTAKKMKVMLLELINSLEEAA